jgi:Tfp pilus assembly protein PilF
MRARGGWRVLTRWLVLHALRPLLGATWPVIEAAAVAIVRWGSTWERSRGRGHIADDAAKRFAWFAWQRIESKDWRSARYFAKAAIAADPSYADGYRMLAVAYDGAGQRIMAREACERGLRMAPDKPSCGRSSAE